MLRMLPLLALALLPAAAAAPVPAAGRPSFGANGLLSRAELEKVTFAARFANQKERLAQSREAAEVPDKGAVAVYLPWHRFTEGEPVPAYFVFKNSGARALALDGRLDLFGPRPSAWGTCAMGVFAAKTDYPVLVFNGDNSANGSERMVVPANGFYCVRYDVGRTAEGGALAPGEYEVEWRCAGLYSAPARFTITRREDGAKLVAVAPRERVHFYRLEPARDKEKRPAKAGAPYVWDACDITRVFAGDVLAALSVGQQGAYVPDLHGIPESDRLVQVSAVWKPDRVSVTLTARDPRKPVRFAERPHLHVHFRATDDGDLPDPPDKPPADAKAQDDEALVTPLTIEARLPADWLAKTGVHNSARVAVLVTSATIDFPRDKGRGPKDRRADPVWEGVLLTPFTEPRFPPARHDER